MRDELKEAIEHMLKADMASVSLLQRKMRLGYNQAFSLIEELEEMKVVGPFRGTKPREILIKDIGEADR